MLLLSAAFACDKALLATLPIPDVADAKPIVAQGAGKDGDVKMAGARVTYKSAHTLAEWMPVLESPEDQDAWHPKEMGTRRAERLDEATLFQQIDISLFFGAITIRRQIVAGIQWIERSPTVIRNCWRALDPEPWAAKIAVWRDDAPFQLHGMGSWDVRALPDGGTSISYTFWADTGAMPAKVQAWAMSRTLPELMAAFEAYVGTPAALR